MSSEASASLMAAAASDGGKTAWIEYTSPDGRAYYFNRDTRVTTWEKPDELKSPEERASVWKEYAKDGRPYWYNTVTKQSTWTKPTELTKGNSEGAPPDSGDNARSNAGHEVAVATGATDKPIAEVAATAVQQESSTPDAAQQMPQMQVPRPDATFLPPGAAPGVGPGIRPGIRPPPPVPSKAALEAMRSATRQQHTAEYRTAEEAEQAFIDMLKAHKITGDWTWEQTMRAVVNNPTYRALKTLQERKEAFSKYISKVRDEEREQRRQKQKKRREEFFAMMDTLPISEFTRFRKVAHLASELPAFTNVPTVSERNKLFDEYVDEYAKELKEARRKARNERMSEVAEYLVDLKIGAKWADTKVKLVERFQGSLMPILLDDQEKRISMDAVVNRGDMKKGAASGVVDPESGLCMLDLMDAFERAMVKAEECDAEQRQKEKDAMFRCERQNRDRFRELLDEHRAEITPVSTWTEFYPKIKSDPRYIEMLGQPGSTPQELFWDEVELLNEEVYHERKRVEAAMRDRGFRVHADTPLSDVQKFVRDHVRTSIKNIEYVHEQLVLKAVRRKEEEEERRQRHKRRILDDFKYALYDLEPPLEADSKWETERARIASLPEFKDVDDEKSCQDVFGHVVERQKERLLQRKRRHEVVAAAAAAAADDSRKRSRSPAANNSLTARQTKQKTEKADGEGLAATNVDHQQQSADYSSELEEGEMLG
ncbi:U1 snRNP protein [Dipsacomyces acuminosporus]|nr:U1 snRNP protein [Dipsacomyces acuminosporus]